MLLRRGFTIFFLRKLNLNSKFSFKNLNVNKYLLNSQITSTKSNERNYCSSAVVSTTSIMPVVEKLQKQKFEEKNYFNNSDPDVFGPGHQVSDAINTDDDDDDDDVGDRQEEQFLTNPPTASQKWTLKQYSVVIKQNLDGKKLKNALDVLEVQMKADRVQPDKYIFNLLISGCAKAGYTRKAFNLFQKMKQCNVKPSSSTYTSLFNACANDPIPADGLFKAKYLRNLLFEQNYVANEKNFHSMIKAFGRCGDIETAFLIADEMEKNHLKFTTETFNFLLQACASHPELGFRYALLTWHKMLKKRCSPDRYSFHTLLRCVRDCSMGSDSKEINIVIKELLGSSSSVKVKQTMPELIANTELKNDDNLLKKDLAMTLVNKETNSLSVKDFDCVPNLISTQPYLGNMIIIDEIVKPEDRLLLLGGFSGFLQEMHNHKITPNIEVFTTMLEVIPSTVAAEKKLVSMIRKIGLKADVDFFNILIKKRSMRFDYDGAREVFNLIRTAKLEPNIVTYGVLALSCKSEEEAREFINEMREKSIRMNIQILGAMLRQGCVHKNFKYVSEILQISLDENIKPNGQFLKHLDQFNRQYSNAMNARHRSIKSNKIQIDFRKFKEKLEMWQGEYGILGLKLEDAIKKIRKSPYKQFKENYNNGYEETKSENYMRKQKIRKYIKRIKMKDFGLTDDENGQKLLPV